MAKSVKLKIITPSQIFYDGEVEMLIVRTVSGEEGFMAGHTWACKLLAVGGKLCIRESGAKELRVAAISSGFVDVKENFVVYTDAAVWAEDIDIERARAIQAEAEEFLKQENQNPDEVKTAKAALERAANRIKVAEGVKAVKH